MAASSVAFAREAAQHDPDGKSQAREAAGDGDVTVMGAGAAQALLRAGELDEPAQRVTRLRYRVTS